MRARLTTNSCGLTGIVLVLLSGWLTLLPSTCWATNYYVDANNPNAHDANPGTEAQPWKTLGQATWNVQAGDTVFVKAGVYREGLILGRSGRSTTGTGRTGPVTVTTPITFAAYPGHEGKAIISAAEPVTNWRRCTGPQDCAGNPNWPHLFWADVAALVQSHPDSGFAVRQMFQHGKLLKRSRYPDTGWSYPTSMPDPMRRFADDTLSQPNGHFAGAVCHIKTADWQIDQIPIASFANATITLSNSPRYAITTRYGYYITSIVGEINAEGEWAYDPAKKRIFLWPQGDVADGVEFSYREYCVYSYAGTSWNVLRGLVMRYAYTHAIWLYRSNDMIVEDNTVEYAYWKGIHLQSTEGLCERNQIRHNTIRYCATRGIDVDVRCAYTNIEGNYIYGTGTHTFAGDVMNGRGEAIYITSPYTRVYNNRIDRTGSSAIYVSHGTRRRDISYNYVTNSGLAVADGGALYTGSYSDVPEKDHIHHNIFTDSYGCLSMDRTHDTGSPPTPSTHAGIMHGIYVDEEGNNRIIEHNTVINCRGHGIVFHWAPANVVRNNTLYGNRGAQVAFSGKNEPKKMLVNDTLVDNILFATSAAQRTFDLGMNYDNVRFGQSDRNSFYNPYNESHIFVNRYSESERRWISDDLTLYEWKLLSGYDGASREFSYLEQLPTLSLAEPRTSRIIYNATLDVSTVDLAGKKYCDVQGNQVSGKVTLPPFESKILIALDPNGPAPAAP